MARDTKKALRNLTIYQVFNRNHNESGTFKELESDLDRIKDLGVDVVYLLPVHPIGREKRKGELGSPYSIQDYRSINPEYGTLDDFKHLIDEVHKRDMKIMMDIVINHTSYDSKLLNEHPEWFYKNENGEFANRVGDWWDITDFDYTSSSELWNEMIDMLKYWASLGIDGYRCDVAPLIPIEFWELARKAVGEIKGDFIWLTESVHLEFIKDIRDMGYECHSDCEMYQAFDITYDYDIHHIYMAYLKGECSLKEYIDRIKLQEVIYPTNYIKLRNLENHDQPRVASLVQDLNKLRNLTAFNFMQKGAAMIYAGQEALVTKRPDLFNKDIVNWDHYDEHNIVPLIKTLSEIKKYDILAHGKYDILDINLDNTIHIQYEDEQNILVGIFNLGDKGLLEVNLPNGTYTNLINNQEIDIENNKINMQDDPVVFIINK